MTPVFAVFYSPVSNLMTQIVHLDIRPGATDSSLKTELATYSRSGEKMILIPSHQAANMGQVLGALGISLKA